MSTHGFFGVCANSDVGVPFISCMNEATSYALGWVLIAMLFLVLYRNVDAEPAKDRFAIISLVLSIASVFMIASGFLPESAYIYFVVMLVGSMAALVFRK